MDGTRFAFSIEEEAERRIHAKGHKRKQKLRATFRLRLRPKVKRYAHLESLQAGAEGALKLPPSMSVKALRVTPAELSLCATYKLKRFNEEPPYDFNLSRAASAMFLSLYQVLNLSRRLTRSGPPPR